MPAASTRPWCLLQTPLRCSCLALSLILAAASAMNLAVFPHFLAVFAFARELSIAINALALTGIGLIATYRPHIIASCKVVPMTLGLTAVGAPLLIVGLASGHPFALTAGACITALCRGIATVAVGMAVSRLPLRQAGLCIALAFVADYVLSTLFWFLPSWCGGLCFMLFPLVALGCVWNRVRQMLADMAIGASPADLSVTQPTTLLPLASRLYACLLLFRIAFGFSLNLSEPGAAPLADFLGIVPVAIVALYVLVLQRPFSSDMVTRISVLLIIAGFLVMSSAAPFALEGGAVLLSMGNTAFDMVAWLVLVSLARRSRHAGVAMFSWGLGVASIGSVIGAVLGDISIGLLGNDDAALSLLCGAIVLAIVAYALIGLRDFSFAHVIEGVAQAAPHTSGAAGPDGAAIAQAEADGTDKFAQTCDMLAEQYKLSPREREVFEMLARGRDRTYIEQKLTISRNTVKAHVKHIYAKLDIHSHQELLDLVEHAWEKQEHPA